MFDIVKKLYLKRGSYVIVGGGVLEALGIRNTEDIDIVVDEETFAKLSKDGSWKKSITPKGSPKLKQKLSNSPYRAIELYLEVNAGSFQPTPKELFARAFYVNDCAFLSLEDLKALKSEYNREKDRKDLALIASYLRQ